MFRSFHFWGAASLMLALVLALSAYGQDSATPMPAGSQSPAPNPKPPRSDSDTDSNADSARPQLKNRRGPLPSESPSEAPNDSSSRSNMIDLSPPIGDAQEHPDSEIPDDLGMNDKSDTNEMHPWNPHKAEKDVEIGDYYFKEKNYRAAESRYREALYYKDNDAAATFRLAQVLDKTGQSAEALEYYQAYLKILPQGPYASDCRKALERLQAQSKSSSPTAR